MWITPEDGRGRSAKRRRKQDRYSAGDPEKKKVHGAEIHVKGAAKRKKSAALHQISPKHSRGIHLGNSAFDERFAEVRSEK